jgi:seryl-tRNA synthetase
MALSNPVKLMGRVVLLLYGLSGGPPEPQKSAETKQQIAEQRASSLEKLRQAREAAARNRGDVPVELKSAIERANEVMREIEERLHEAERANRQQLDEKLREVERLKESLQQAQSELKRLQENEETLQKQLDEVRRNAVNTARQPLPTEQIQLSNPHSRRSLLLDRLVLRPAPQEGMRPIDGHGWRVDRQGIIRNKQNEPIGVWGVDEDERAVQRAR